MIPTYHDTKAALLTGGKSGVCLHYQPIHCLSTGELRGYEALARWGRMPPPLIAEVVEEHSLQALWVECQIEQINKALAQLPSHLWVSLNLSQSALALHHLPNLIGKTPNPKRLHLEILEGVLITDNIAHVLEGLQATYILIADDIGSVDGDSIGRMIGSAADFFGGIKLCQALSQRVLTHRKTAAFCAMMLAVADVFGLITIAEWVESFEQAKWLAGKGCDMGQGSYFAMPKPLEEILNTSAQKHPS